MEEASVVWSWSNCKLLANTTRTDTFYKGKYKVESRALKSGPL